LQRLVYSTQNYCKPESKPLAFDPNVRRTDVIRKSLRLYFIVTLSLTEFTIPHVVNSWEK